jgi:flagellar biosynthesis chaperone FliJ
MAEKNDTKQGEKKKGFFERNGFITSDPKKSSEQSNSSESETNTDSAFVFDFTEATSKSSESSIISEPVVVKKVQSVTSTNIADPKISEKLKKVLTDSNFPGPDYFEFKQQLDALSDIIPDELTRYKAAYKSLVVQGVTKDKITDSAGKYVEILTAENNKFSEAISQKNSTDIDLKTQEAKVLNTENVNMQKQIDVLNAKISENSQKIKGLGAEVQKAQVEISDARKRFENTLNIFVNEIKTNANKVESYIQ